MAPKRKATESSSSFDRRRFRSKEASDFYASNTHNAKFARERPVEYESRVAMQGSLMATERWFASVLRERRWEEICSITDSGCMKLVREFYANAKEPHSDTRTHPTYMSSFRTSPIDYSPQKIRELLDLPTEEEIEEKFGHLGLDYHSLLQNYPEDLIFETVVGRREAKWHPDEKNKLFVKRVDLKPQLRVWSFLAGDNFLPTLGKSELRKEMLVLIFCIHQGFGVDLAKIISWRIHQIANVREDFCLGYPLLINKLVRSQVRSELLPAVQEEVQPNRVLTLNQVINMLKSQEKTLAAPPEARPPPTGPTPHRASSSSSVPPSDEAPAWAVAMQQNMMMRGGSILTRMRDMDANMQTLRGAGGDDMPIWRDFAPYSELEQQMMDLHLGSFPGPQNDDDDYMT